MIPTLVFLHHFGGSARSWDGVIDRLGGAFPTLALDLPGFGDAGGAPGPFTIDAYTDWLEGEVRPCATAGAIIIGHSMGGKLALATAARQPAWLRSLVLLAPSPPSPEPIADDARAALHAGWADLDTATRTLDRNTAQPLAQALRRGALDDWMRSGKQAWIAWLEIGSREDITAVMLDVAVPVLLLSGARDIIVPTALINAEIVPRLPNARLQTVPGAGHLLPVEAPDIVAAMIAEFAKSNIHLETQ